MSNVPYASVVGGIVYVMLCARSTNSFVVGFTTHYQSKLRPTQWQPVNRIMRYLRGTINLVLCYYSVDLRSRG